MSDNLIYLLLFVGAFMLVLVLAECFANFCIWVIESGKHRSLSWHIAQTKKRRYNPTTREYKK
jgi:hypothetical protein